MIRDLVRERQRGELKLQFTGTGNRSRYLVNPVIAGNGIVNELRTLRV